MTQERDMPREDFAMLFDTAHGQLLVFLDETDEGDPAISIVGAEVRGVRPKAKLSGWSDGDAGQLRNFNKTDQVLAESFAAQLYQSADRVAPRDSDVSPKGGDREDGLHPQDDSAGRKASPTPSIPSVEE